MAVKMLRNEHHRAMMVIVATNGLAAPLVTIYEWLISPFETFVAFARGGLLIVLLFVSIQTLIHDQFIKWLLKPARQFLLDAGKVHTSANARLAIESLSRYPPLSAAGSILAWFIVAGAGITAIYDNYPVTGIELFSFLSGFVSVCLLITIFQYYILKGRARKYIIEVIEICPTHWQEGELRSMRTNLSLVLTVVFIALVLISISFLSIAGYSLSRRAIQDIVTHQATEIMVENSSGDEWKKVAEAMNISRVARINSDSSLTGPADVKVSRKILDYLQNTRRESGNIYDSSNNNLVIYNKLEGSIELLAVPWNPFESNLLRLKFLLLFSFISLLGLAGGIAYLCARDFSYPIKAMIAMSAAVADGDLDTPLGIARNDEFGDLANAMSEMRLNIKGLLKRSNLLMENISVTIEKLSSSTQKIKSICENQTSGASRQVQAVSEVDSSCKEMAKRFDDIEYMADSVRDISEKCSTAIGDASKNIRQTVEGMENVKDIVYSVNDGMKELEEHSESIRNILGAISYISEQTELLSVNAALEAAGAGGVGRRFSVVAQEIKRLAKQSDSSTKQIKEIIVSVEDAVSRVRSLMDEALKVVNQQAVMVEHSGETLEQATGLVSQSQTAGKEITTATVEHGKATDELAETISRVSDVAKDVEMSARETETYIKQLNELSQSLSGLMDSEVK